MAREGITPATDEYATVNKNDTVLILHTGTKPYELNSGFKFAKKTCLIYAENVLVSGPLDFRGKSSFGLFCSNITVKGKASIDISGLAGEDQPPTVGEDGRHGTDGTSGGKAWLFVQHLEKDSLKSLAVLAHGGRGGRGGDTTAAGKTGGAGGNGGNSGKLIFTHCSLPKYQLN